ncbi:hypothetical protein C0J50_19563 [Silurus asotus]|uniref:Uncharacterized protein n=1 Tax=Silurus asotus TaxID=30991 RepID=A0AAD5AR77_SILAS|nr:hypothetical protein C0J50_19563 [Silurus asotus]
MDFSDGINQGRVVMFVQQSVFKCGLLAFAQPFSTPLIPVREEQLFSKHGIIQTVPSLAKRLKTVTDPVVGLQYVWEYRSPSKLVAPHYQCRLCKVQRLQNEMAAHITGWRHCFQYLKHAHPDKMPYEEEEVGRNPVFKKEMRVNATEVESAEGRGQIKVITREPADVPAFQNMSGSFGGFMNQPFTDDFAPRGGMMSDFLGGSSDGHLRSPDRYGNSGPDRMMGEPASMQCLSNSRSVYMGSDGFGMGSRSDDMGRPYSNDLLMTSSDRMMRSKSQESNNTLATLLRCLDTFRIECEDDAQIVLKITQKLTDVLMEYRLRSISSDLQDSITELFM